MDYQSGSAIERQLRPKITFYEPWRDAPVAIGMDLTNFIGIAVTKNIVDSPQLDAFDQSFSAAVVIDANYVVSMHEATWPRMKGFGPSKTTW